MTRLMVVALFLFGTCASAQESFDVATIRPSKQSVAFERDGETTISHGTLAMHDVTLITCIKYAYHVQRAQIVEMDGMDRQHYDITAKTDATANDERMRQLLQALLVERFGLKFHPGTKDTTANVLTVGPQGLKKMKPSASQDGDPWHQNSALGMVGKNFTMNDFVTYVSDPLGTPLVDETHLPGKYDFSFDFRGYVDQAAEIHADPQAVLRMTFEGELGLKMVRRRATIQTMVIDQVTPPTEN